MVRTVSSTCLFQPSPAISLDCRDVIDLFSQISIPHVSTVSGFRDKARTNWVKSVKLYYIGIAYFIWCTGKFM